MKEERTVVKTTVVNRKEGWIAYEDTRDKDETVIDDLKSLYHFGVKEYGRCTGKVYIDTKDGKSRHIGYVFVKNTQYTDTNETYLQETWLTLEHYIKEETIEYLPVS